MLEKLHLSQSGENQTLALARGIYFWPGIVKDIKKLVWSCQECEQYRVSKPPEMYVQTLDANNSRQELSMDLA